MNRLFLALFALLPLLALGDDKYSSPFVPTKEMEAAKLNTTTGGPYTYDISSHHFSGTAYDGSWIDTTSACSGSVYNGCRNNVNDVCVKDCGPLPPGTYTLGSMFTYKGYPYSYQLYPASTNNMCGRSDFLIHGGDCGSGNPSIGCIVIPNESTRYLIKSGATLKVVL